MEQAIRQKEKSFKHVFKGSVLVNALMDHDNGRFAGREEAVVFAQHLLNAGHLKSVVDGKDFEDSAALYRWADASLVKEAKKIHNMVTTTSGHIPRKRLIELVDLQHAEGQGTTVDATRDRLTEHGRSSVAASGSQQSEDQQKAAGQRTRRAGRVENPHQAAAGPSQATNGYHQPAAVRPEGDARNRRPRSRERSRDPPRSTLQNPKQETVAHPKTSLTRTASQRIDPKTRTSPMRQNSQGSEQPRVSSGSSLRQPSPGGTQRRVRKSASMNESVSGKYQYLQNADSANTVSQTDKTAAQNKTDSEGMNPSVNGSVPSDRRSRLSSIPVPVRRGSSSGQTPPDPPGNGPGKRYPSAESLSSVKRQQQQSSQSTLRTSSKSQSETFLASPAQLTPHRRPVGRSASQRETPTASRRITPSRSQSNASQSQGRADRRSKLSKTNAPNTCRYDGVDMPALNLEQTETFPQNTSQSQPVSPASPPCVGVPVKSPTSPDNESRLREEMARMKQEHVSTVQTYEEKVTQLMSTLHDLRNIANRIEQSDTQQQDTNHQHNAPVPPPRAPPPPVGPPGVPPPPPGVPPPPPPQTASQKLVKPNKEVVKPRVKMRPLFWNRIILDGSGERREAEEDEGKGSMWKGMTEPNFDVEEFESLFGQSKDQRRSSVSLHIQSSSRDSSVVPEQPKMKTVKLLDDNRSKAVAIRLRSMHCKLEDIQAAIYNVDFTLVDLDSLYGLCEIGASKEELDKIHRHLEEKPCVPLDEPEECLLELSRMKHFPERVHCLMFRKAFNESIFNIDQQLCTVEQACSVTRSNTSLQRVMEMVLALGNYMNGGTHRGQADGFDLAILPKLRDVKSMDNSMNLLQYIVSLQCREGGDDVGHHQVPFPLPDPALLSQVTNVTFTELDKELARLQKQLKTHSGKAEAVYAEADPKLLQPFKDIMDDFFDSADHLLSQQTKKMASTKDIFHSLAEYLGCENLSTGSKDKPAGSSSVPSNPVPASEGRHCTPDALFGILSAFLEDYKVCWKEEQTRIAREMFARVEMKKKERFRSIKRRNSFAGSDGASPARNNLKQKFSLMRKQSESSQGTVNLKLLRSQSVTSLNGGSERQEGASSPSSSVASGVSQTSPRDRSLVITDIPIETVDPQITDNPSVPQRQQPEKPVSRAKSFHGLAPQLRSTEIPVMAHSATNPIQERMYRRKLSRNNSTASDSSHGPIKSHEQDRLAPPTYTTQAHPSDHRTSSGIHRNPDIQDSLRIYIRESPVRSPRRSSSSGYLSSQPNTSPTLPSRCQTGSAEPTEDRSSMVQHNVSPGYKQRRQRSLDKGHNRPTGPPYVPPQEPQPSNVHPGHNSRGPNTYQRHPGSYQQDVSHPLSEEDIDSVEYRDALRRASQDGTLV